MLKPPVNGTSNSDVTKAYVDTEDKKLDDKITVLNNGLETVNNEMQEVKHSVSNGKSLIASAITDKGIPTLATDSFEDISNNISNIVTITNSITKGNNIICNYNADDWGSNSSNFLSGVNLYNLKKYADFDVTVTGSVTLNFAVRTDGDIGTNSDFGLEFIIYINNQAKHTFRYANSSGGVYKVDINLSKGDNVCVTGIALTQKTGHRINSISVLCGNDVLKSSWIIKNPFAFAFEE